MDSVETHIEPIEIPDAAPGAGPCGAPGWAASIDIAFASRGGSTRLARCAHAGPLYVQRALYPEGPHPAHIYLLHPPGGVVQGDVLDVRVTSPADTAALVTTPAAGKLYRAPVAASTQRFTMNVAAGAALEWLPQETLVFDGARAGSALTLNIADASRVIAWDIVGLGRPASGERFVTGCFRSALRVVRDGLPVFVESGRIPGLAESGLQPAAWGLGGRSAFGTLIAYTPEGFGAEAVAAARAAGESQCGFGVTEVDGVLVVRMMADQTAEVRERLSAAWRVLRPAVVGRDAVAPRIWST